MEERDTIINVANYRVQVAEMVTGPRAETFEVVPAANWEDLEDEALDAVIVQGGACNLSGWYSCPNCLVERAQWPRN